MLAAFVFTASVAFGPTSLLSRSAIRPSSAVRMDMVESMKLADGRRVKVFSGEAAIGAAIVAEVKSTAAAAIAAKGSFSLAIPGGSVVTALSALTPDSCDFSKFHIFFCNERIGENKCYKGALEAFATKCNVPLAQVHGVGTGEPADVAAKYEAMLKADKSVDNSGAVPSVDLTLLGTGDDGHCGSLYPDQAPIKMTGSGKAVLPISEGDKKSIAVSMDFMRASKKVIVSAATGKRAEMVARALSGSFGPYDCPSGMVNAKDTTWFVDTASIALYKK